MKLKATTFTYVVLVVLFAGFAQKTTAQITLDPSVMIESTPYAPVAGIRLSKKPNVIVGLEIIADSTGTSLLYLRSMSSDTSGQYDGIFLVQKFRVFDQKFKGKLIHFADFRSEGKGLTVLALEALGGEKLKWSIQGSYFDFQSRSSRWIINPSLSYDQFTIGSWIYNEFGDWSVTMGAKWKSPKLSISKTINLQAQAIYNDSLTKRFNGDGFGQQNTISIGLTFTPNGESE